MKLNIFLTSSNGRHFAMDRLRTLRVATMAVGFFALLGAFGSVAAQPKIVLETTPTQTEIPLEAGSNVIIDPLSGDITARPADPAACSGSGDCDAQVDLISFTVNPSTVAQNLSFSASFSQRGAWECERTGLPGTDWDTTWTAPNQLQSVVNVGSTNTGPYTLTLTCRNGTSGGDAIDSIQRSLTVIDGGGSADCTGRTPPTAWSRENNADASVPTKTTQTWISMFGGDGFPNGDGVNMRIRSNRYGAFSFNTGTSGQSGQINFADLGASVINVRQGPAVVSLSACEGDFLPQTGDQALCRLAGVGSIVPNFQWKRSSAPPITACVLPPNENFFLNVTFINSSTVNDPDPNNWVWGCASDAPPLACGWRMTHTFTP